MKNIDMFDIAVFLTCFGLASAALIFLNLGIKNWENRGGKLRFIGLSLYCFAGSSFFMAVYRAIEGKSVKALLLLGSSILLMILGFSCRKKSKEVS